MDNFPTGDWLNYVCAALLGVLWVVIMIAFAKKYPKANGYNMVRLCCKKLETGNFHFHKSWSSAILSRQF